MSSVFSVIAQALLWGWGWAGLRNPYLVPEPVMVILGKVMWLDVDCLYLSNWDAEVGFVELMRTGWNYTLAAAEVWV